MKKKLLFFTLNLLFVATFFSCQKTNETVYIEAKPSKDLVHQHLINKVRLGDGVPLGLDLGIRWKVSDLQPFYEQFSSIDSFNLMILRPRSHELVSLVAHSFESIDSVFYTQRQLFIGEIKDKLMDELGEEGIVIKEIILKDIYFPQSYTKAMEQAGLHRQEIERISQEKLIQKEEAIAKREKAEADGKVAIAKAEAESKIQKIKAETEKYHRQNELAKAETQAQVDRTRAKAEGERLRLLAQAEVDNKRELKNLEMQRLKELDQLALDKQRKLNLAEMDHQVALANLCTSNPVYASYLVNKELAANVEFAVLPTGTDTDIFSNIMNNKMPGTKKRVLAE